MQIDLQALAIFAPSGQEREARSGLTQAAGDPDEDLVIRAVLAQGMRTGGPLRWGGRRPWMAHVMGPPPGPPPGPPLGPPQE